MPNAADRTSMIRTTLYLESMEVGMLLCTSVKADTVYWKDR